MQAVVATLGTTTSDAKLPRCEAAQPRLSSVLAFMTSQRDACQSAAYALRRTCHASELRATPSKISWIPSKKPSSQTAVVVRLAKR